LERQLLNVAARLCALENELLKVEGARGPVSHIWRRQRSFAVVGLSGTLGRHGKRGA